MVRLSCLMDSVVMWLIRFMSTPDSRFMGHLRLGYFSHSESSIISSFTWNSAATVTSVHLTSYVLCCGRAPDADAVAIAGPAAATITFTTASEFVAVWADSKCAAGVATSAAKATVAVFASLAVAFTTFS